MWKPLKTSSSFRIPRLHPGSPSQRIRCSLQEHVLGPTTTPPYQALSYTWGSRSNSVDIVCNGVTVQVTPNLHSALVRLRSDSRYMDLWVDALCINQSTAPKALREKEAQILHLWKIFSGAVRVVIDLGADVVIDKVGDLRQFLATFDDFLAESRNPGRYGSSVRDLVSHIGRSRLPGIEHDCWPLLLKILHRPYFTRAWVVQEYVMAGDVVFLIKSETFDGQFLSQASLARQYINLLGQEYLQQRQRIPELSRELQGTDSQFVYPLEGFRRAWQSRDTNADRQELFEELVLSGARYGATDMRDRVYAFLGLYKLAGKADFRVDYSEALEDLERRFTDYLFRNSDGASILYFCHGCNSSQSSWAINLTHYNADFFKIVASSYNHLYVAGHGPREAFVSLEGRRLRISVRMLGFVDRISEANPLEMQAAVTQHSAEQGIQLFHWFQTIDRWIASVKSHSAPSLDPIDVWRTVLADVVNMRRMSDTGYDKQLPTIIAKLTPLLSQAMENITSQENISRIFHTWISSPCWVCLRVNA